MEVRCYASVDFSTTIKTCSVILSIVPVQSLGTSHIMTQPLPKRRRLGESGDNGSLDQQSFAAVLEQLEAEDDGSGGKFARQ